METLEEMIQDSNTEVKSDEDKMELYSDSYPFNLPLRIKRFENESDYNKFIKNCELLIRRSLEYKDWRNYIIEVLGINTCMITDERIDEVSVEVHHHLPSMFTLVKGITNKKLAKDKEFSTFDIATEAIELHFKNKVGYVTLVKTLHEKFHNGFLDIPKEYIKGDYNYFLKNYSEFLDSEELDNINSRLIITETNAKWARNNYKEVEDKNE